MDKLGEKKTENKIEKQESGRFFEKIKKGFSQNQNGGQSLDRRILLRDIIVFAVGFVLSRCHVFFGARPVGLAFVALLPTCVWQGAAGAIIGNLTMGIDGIVFAAATAVTMLLRAAISSGDRDENGKRLLFKENLLTRMSVSVLGGFVTAVYEILTEGLNEASLLFGLVMIILTPILTFAISGLFFSGMTLDRLLRGEEDLLSIKDREKDEKYDRIFFQFSALLLIFLISLSFRGVSIIGISLSYIFSALITLLCAKRFGGVRGAAVGFISSLCISTELSVAFALMGLGAGVMFGFGTVYAIIIGGVALCAWSIYADGMSGLLSTFPEYAVATAIATPILSKLTVTEEKESKNEPPPQLSEDMVGTMALSYQSSYQGGVASLSNVMEALGTIISSHTAESIKLSTEEYRDIVISVAERNCIGCLGGSLCAREDIRPCIKNASKIAILLGEGMRINADDVNSDTEFCQRAEIIAEQINDKVDREERERRLVSEREEKGEEYRLIASLLNEMIDSDKSECAVDNSLTAPLTKVLNECGLEGGTIRAFGERRRHFILAGEDEGGGKISSFELRKSIETAASVRLDTPEYFKKDKMMLMECGTRPKYRASFATACRAGSDNEVSGDTALCFVSKKDYFYSLICDGMGSGELAQKTSEFSAEFIKTATDAGAIKDAEIHMLNHSLRTRNEECSATIDLFELDLLNGKGLFIKSGAAPSYVKRESSIFRIRSQTAPIGLLRTVDTEKIRLEIKAGDHIIMLSDGIADATEDAPWLLLLLGEPPKKSLQEYADTILNEAIKKSRTHDDMTVTVIRIEDE